MSDLEDMLRGSVCKYCGHKGIRLESRLEARPLGTHSLAGVQVKFSARPHPYAVCDGCGHASRGEPAEG